MSDFENNPFADPHANQSPFSDPSVQRAVQPGYQSTGATVDEYNPFADKNQTKSQGANQPSFQQQQQPAVMQPTEQPPAYTPSAAAAAAQPVTTNELQKRQEELEKKAAELARREQAMQQSQNPRTNNFPPLPARCPIQPCFYQDFSVDIPQEFRKTVKIIYYLWMFYSVVLFLNVFGSLSYFIASSQAGVPNQSGITFGLSILFFVLFTPASFVCWYRPAYKAFRSDSSFNFFVFFFIFFIQFCVTIIQGLGIDGTGTCGWLNGFALISRQQIGVAIMLLIFAVFFHGIAVMSIIILIRVHRIYRSTGASFEKAQSEFATGVMSNRNVQSAAANVASTAAQGAVQSQFSGAATGNRY